MRGKEIRYYAEIKAIVTKADKLLAIMRKGEFDTRFCLVTKIHKHATGGRIETEWDEFLDTAGIRLSISHLYTFL